MYMYMRGFIEFLHIFISLLFLQYLTANELRDEPLPRSMKFYDTSGDEQITLREFSGALGHSPTEKHVQMAFTMADSDGKFDFKKILRCRDILSHNASHLWCLMFP